MKVQRSTSVALPLKEINSLALGILAELRYEGEWEKIYTYPEGQNDVK